MALRFLGCKNDKYYDPVLVKSLNRDRNVSKTHDSLPPLDTFEKMNIHKYI